MNNYYELRISINPEIEEIVSNICFSNFDCEGVVLAEETYKDLEMTSTTRGTLRVFLTDLNNNPIEVLKTERELLKERGFSDEELGSWEISLDEKENQDWSKKWKEKWTVTHVTDRIAVVPSWIDYVPRDGEITITLDPGCAFGTGTHQTTQLCMKAIEKHLKVGDTMADIGTGSGILAVCAMKFGAKSAYGCDNDETVIDVCKENAQINGLEVNPTLEGGSKSSISGWGENNNITNEFEKNTEETNFQAYPTLEGGSKSLISGWGKNNNTSNEFEKNQNETNFQAYPTLEGGSKSSISGWGENSKQDAIHKYPKSHINYAKEMRNNPTDAEAIMWKYLRNSNLCGIKFRRQQPIDKYIVDFMSASEKLIIELDGGGHNSGINQIYDSKRDEYLSKLGYTVIRIWNTEIYKNIDGVLDYILKVINDPTRKSKIFTLPQGEGSIETQSNQQSKNSNIIQEEDISNICFELNTADKITEKYDFVCANILHNVLAEIMGDLKNIMKDSGKLVLSGILDEKKQVVLDAIEKFGLKIIETNYQDQWISFVVEK